MSCETGRLEPPREVVRVSRERGRATVGDWKGTRMEGIWVGYQKGEQIGSQIRIWREVCSRHRVCVAVLTHASLQACVHASNRERSRARCVLASTPPCVRRRAHARVAAVRVSKAHGNGITARMVQRSREAVVRGQVEGGLAINNPYFINTPLQVYWWLAGL